MGIGERIKEARKSMGMTQRELADLIGAKHNSVSDWENNKNKPDADTIERLCETLDLMPNDFFENSSRKDNGDIIGRIMKDQDTINMIKEYYSLEEENKKAIRRIVFSLSKKE